MAMVWILSVLVSVGSASGMADTAFVQECHTPYPVACAPGGDDVRAVAVDGAGCVWAATGASVYRWDENLWRVVQGDGGQTESDGIWWLLPYWMGRHYGYIQSPSQEAQN